MGEEGGENNGITGTEVCYGAVQKTALRLHGGAITRRTAEAAQGIRIRNREVNVRPDYSGSQGAAGAGRLQFGGYFQKK